MSAEELKAQGNAAFGAGNFPEAVEHFTAAIAADPGNHVLYSNRSAAHASMGQYGPALEDARKTVELKADWPKGYSRLGAAHYGLRNWEDAAAAYSKGLELDPANAQLKQGLQDAQAAAAPRRPPAAAYSAPPPGTLPAHQAGPAGELVLLAAHVLLIALAVLTVQPLHKSLGWQAFFLFCRVSLVASGYKIYLRFGLPPLRPFPAALGPWAQRMATSNEFFTFILSTIISSVPQMWAAVVPIAVLAAFPALEGLEKRFGGHPLWQAHGSRARAALEARKPDALRFVATMELVVGFQLILNVLSSGLRGAMLAYVYWNSLRVRFWAPESRPYHLLAWATINARVAPLVQRVPVLQRAADAGVRWFQAIVQQQPAQ